jgi:hypothetical protein
MRDVVRIGAGILGAILGLGVGQGVAVMLPDGPYLVIAGALLACIAVALLIGRAGRRTPLRYVAIGFAVIQGLLLLLFAGGN